VICLHADGFIGYDGYAPYDGILAAAVSEDVPEELINQLSDEGRLVMPVIQKSATSEQQLIVVDKTSTGIKHSVISDVAFVPRISGTS